MKRVAKQMNMPKHPFLGSEKLLFDGEITIVAANFAPDGGE